MKKTVPFDEPIYVTRPMLADLGMVNLKLQEIWSKKWLTNNGPQHIALEQELKKNLKVSNISLFNNGTIALLVACKSLNLSGEVITTPFTFAATPHSLSWSNLEPVFCDIDAHTMTIDPEKIEELITPRTTAILGVHVFGVPCDVYRIHQIADKYKLKIIFDAAHAFNTEINGVGIGSFGDISMFSFHSTKLFHTLEGGALTFNDESLKAKIELMKNFGIKNEEEVDLVGINGKMNEVQAAVGMLNLEYLAEERLKREQIIAHYKKNLCGIGGITFYDLPENIRNSLQYFVVRINRDEFGMSRDQVHLKLKEYNVFARKYFYPLCSNFSCYANIVSAKAEKLPIANQVANEVLSMPLYGDLKVADIDKICDIILKLKSGSL